VHMRDGGGRPRVSRGWQTEASCQAKVLTEIESFSLLRYNNGAALAQRVLRSEGVRPTCSEPTLRVEMRDTPITTCVPHSR